MELAEAAEEMGNAETEVLPAVGMMAELSDELRERFGAAGRFIERSPGAYLAIQGKPHNVMSFIIAGKIAISTHAHGDMVNLGVLGPGDVVGEMSLIDPRFASANARVVGDDPARLWVIDGGAYVDFLDSDPIDGFCILHALAKILCRRVRKDSELMLRRAAELRERYMDNDF